MRAIELFIAERKAEGGASYTAMLQRNVALAEKLFTNTNDLRDFPSGAALAADPSLMAAARNLAGPPISADDLNTLANMNVATRKRLSASEAREAAEIIAIFADRSRLPWLYSIPVRSPTDAERERAIYWTAGLHTAQELATSRRSQAALRQEAAVRKLLSDLGFVEVPRDEIMLPSDRNPGTFSRETHVVGTKCDIPVCLRDHRLLLIECKVSNSGTNSVKRLNREVGGKAKTWQNSLGAGAAITAAVLSGVFKLKNLRDAQDDPAGPVTIFWEHDLAPLSEFLAAAA